MSSLAERIARYGMLDADAQLACAAVPVLAAQLAQNHQCELTEEVFSQLLRSKPKLPATAATDLVCRPLSTDQIDLVLANETRAAVLTMLVIAHRMTPSQQERLAGLKTCKKSFADALFAQAVPELRTRLAISAGGLTLLEFLADTPADQFSDADAAGWLSKWSSWAPRRSQDRKDTLLRLFERRPALLATAVADHQPIDLVMVAAGNRLLTDESLQWQASRLQPGVPAALPDDPKELRSYGFMWMALGNNPVCSLEVVTAMRDAATPGMGSCESSLAMRLRKTRSRPQITEPFAQVQDPELLDWLVSRSRPWNYEDQHSPGRAWDLLELCSNPHLNEDQATKLYGGIRDLQADLGPSASVAAHALAAHFPKFDATAFDYDPADEAWSPAKIMQTPSDLHPATSEQVRDWTMHQLGQERILARFTQVACEEFAQLDEPVRGWQTLLSLLDSYDPTQPIGLLIDGALALAL